MDRRELLAAGAAGAAAAAAGLTAMRLDALAAPPRPPSPGAPPARETAVAAPGRLRQSVCRWPFAAIPLPAFCAAARGMGLEAVDLLDPGDWPVARDAGLTCSMGNTSRRREFLTSGIADVPMHDTIMRELEDVIPRARAAGVASVIVLSGNRRGRTDAEGVANCVALLQRAMPLAVQEGVTIYLEMLNSKVDHRDHFADTTAFGVAVAEGVGSPRFKLLYDVYHMQIMEGDVIATLRRHARHIGHVHTAGVPGRHELDDTQELNYRAIARTLADAGFGGWVAHEFIPTREPVASLREAVGVCTV